MKYSDLIQFDPIESVVQLRDADVAAEARRLVATYVISDRMAEILTQNVFQQLQFGTPADNRGLLVVGNYGTGKSHLMAVISAVAERADLAPKLTNKAVASSAKAIAGRFKVIRGEVGSTTMTLRQIVCGILEDGLDSLGVSFSFPAADERHENKTAFMEMMAAFQKKFPDIGLLLVLDELLDYLRSRKDTELSLDLSFLREVGEVCKNTRFRFLAGVQEGLFDNARFHHVSETLRRVKDRFEQVRIAREDVAFVVGERLLKKDARQQALVRAHLEQFAPLYSSMNEKMDAFVQLFPVHPAYLDTFERVFVAEKREVLKTLSATMKGLLGRDVPKDDTGLIAYDSYWPVLRDNPSFRSIPDIREVIDKSDVLAARIEQAYTRPGYRPAALRIINALSVHRLTMDNINAPIGATAEELRDDLCLMLPVPERDAEFLKTMIETVLKEILRTVAGQFLSFNPENGQYYLDLKKDIDFDSLIEKRAESLDKGQLDRYHFDAVRRVVLEDPDLPAYVSGYRIWEYEVEWRDHKAGRSGYLFFGAPNERSTAQPPRDFYVYFLQPFDPPFFKDEEKADEVFFRFKQRDDVFDRELKLFAGARELASTASGSNKKVYEDKATDHLRALTTWLRERMPSSFEVIHQGRAKPLVEVVRGKLPSGAAVRDYVNTAASALLAPHFQNLSPDYPIFGVSVTRDNREQAAQDALRWIAGSIKSKQGTAVLDALELLDGDVLRPRDSRYARHVLDLLAQKGQGQVLNRSELVQTDAGVEYWTRFRLEPEFLAVVLAALVHSGDIVLSVPGKRIDAASIDQLARIAIGEVCAFKHAERPRDLPLGSLQELCELLGLSSGLMVNPATRDEAIVQLQQRVGERLNAVVLAQAKLPDIVFWGRPVLSPQEQGEWRERLGSLKGFLESLQPFNTAGKLKNFPHDASAIQAQKSGFVLAREVEDLAALVQQIGGQAAYLGRAEAVLAAGDEWVERVVQAKGEILTKLSSRKYRADPSFQRSLAQTLTQLKSQYQDAYLAAHKRSRLGPNEDKKKGALAKDDRLARLQKLAIVEMMPTPQLHDFQKRLFALKTCFSLTKLELETDPVCPQCSYRPVEEPLDAAADQVLSQLDSRVDGMVGEWTSTLLSNLEDPTVAANIDLVGDAKGKREVKAFLKSRELPEVVSSAFVKALQEVLSGLLKVEVTTSDLRAALAEGGLPCTPVELGFPRFRRHGVYAAFANSCCASS